MLGGRPATPFWYLWTSRGVTMAVGKYLRVGRRSKRACGQRGAVGFASDNNPPKGGGEGPRQSHLRISSNGPPNGGIQLGKRRHSGTKADDTNKQRKKEEEMWRRNRRRKKDRKLRGGERGSTQKGKGGVVSVGFGLGLQGLWAEVVGFILRALVFLNKYNSCFPLVLF